MRVIVCVKFVSQMILVDANHDDGSKTSHLNRNELGFQLNPPDRDTIRVALQLKEQYCAKLVLISMGPTICKAHLHETASFGFDEAVLLSDSHFAGSDTLATSLVLAQAIRKLGDYDLILTGSHSIDSDTGQIGPSLAEHLSIPHTTNIVEIEKIVSNEVIMIRQYEEGLRIRQACHLPALMSISSSGAVNIMKNPTIAARLRAKKMEIPIWSCTDIGINPKKVGISGSSTEVVSVSQQRSTRKSLIFNYENDHHGIQFVANKINEVITL